MSDLIDIYQQYLDMSDEERNNIALMTMRSIFEYLESEADSEDEVLEFVLDMFSVLCCADGTINYEEYEMFKLVTGATVSYDEFFDAVKDGTDPEYVEGFFELVENLDDDFQSDIFVLALCLFTSKGTLTVSEQEFIDEYLF